MYSSWIVTNELHAQPIIPAWKQISFSFTVFPLLTFSVISLNPHMRSSNLHQENNQISNPSPTQEFWDTIIIVMHVFPFQRAIANVGETVTAKLKGLVLGVLSSLEQGWHCMLDRDCNDNC
jgi:hypothetical protein